MDHSLLIAGEGIGGLWGGRSEEMWGGGRIVTQPKSSKLPPPPHPISPRNKKWPVLKVKLRGRSQTAMLMERKLNVVMLGLTKNHMTIPLRKTMHRLMSMTGQH